MAVNKKEENQQFNPPYIPITLNVAVSDPSEFAAADAGPTTPKTRNFCFAELIKKLTLKAAAASPKSSVAFGVAVVCGPDA
jgi:hypothetical protein